MSKPPIGSIVWTDLTVVNADETRDFYKNVLGWQHSAIPMGDYSDYVMKDSEEAKGVAGICHAKGSNANMPAQWMIYVSVASVDQSIEACTANGGQVVDGPRKMGDHYFAVIQDPAGAVMGIIEG